MATVYEILTEKFIDLMTYCRDNDIPWTKPFTVGGRQTSVSTGNNYRGVNQVLLGFSAFRNEFGENRWGTYKGWQKLDGQVRKGEKSTVAMFYKSTIYKAENSDGETEERQGRILRYFRLFNADQVDGIERVSVADRVDLTERLEQADKFLGGCGAEIKLTDSQPCYHPTQDYINLATRETYKDTPTSTATECFYSTWAHELTHWTGHETRLARPLNNKFTSKEYAYEELIAELGAAFLCCKLEISNEPRADNAAYCNSWLSRMENDPKIMLRASSAASKAVDFLEATEE